MAPPTLGVGIRQHTKLAHDAPVNILGVVRSSVRPVGKPPKPARGTRERTSKAREDSQAADLDSAEEISVALEWKLLFPLLTQGSNDPEPNDRRRVVEAQCEDEVACLVQAHECVAHTIREFGEKAVTFETILGKGIEEKEFWDSTWIVKKANSAEPMDQEKSLEGYLWVPVEICSPRMFVRDPNTRARMQGVLNALTSAHRLAANCSCEVHIHLGRMDGRAWSLSTLKRLGSLLWLAEPTLRSIRDPNSANYHNTYTWGFAMRQHSRLRSKVAGLNSLSTSLKMAESMIRIPDEQVVATFRSITQFPAKELLAISEIWQAPSRLELGRLLSGPEKKYRRLGFNFSSFGEEDERARRSPRTVEFRFMEGSVDPDLILSWLEVCGTIVETAVVRSDGRYVAALSQALQLRTEDRHTSRSSERLGERRAHQFRDLMEAFGVLEKDYCGLTEKIKREH